MKTHNNETENIIILFMNLKCLINWLKTKENRIMKRETKAEKSILMSSSIMLYDAFMKT